MSFSLKKTIYIILLIIFVYLFYKLFIFFDNPSKYIDETKDLSIIKTVKGVDNNGNLFTYSDKVILKGNSYEILEIKDLLTKFKCKNTLKTILKFNSVI